MSIAELMSQTKDPSVMKQWLGIIDEYSKKLPTDYYCMFYDDIYETIYGEVLSEEKAQTLVKAMKPYGEVWTLSEVDDVLGGNCKKSTKYYVMNMLYNDYYNMFKDDTDKYLEMAKLWLNDVDSDGGDIKTYRYATRV